MNLTVRMMKRYIKTPLKYALPLLFIGALVLVSISGPVSISGCVATPSPSASGVPTATPNATATPTTSASFDPLLTKMAAALTSEGYTVTKQPKDGNTPSDQLAVDFTTSKAKGFPANGYVAIYIIRNDSTASGKVLEAKPLSGDTSERLLPENDTFFGEQAATIALGHQPTSVNEVYVQDMTRSGIDLDYLNYDSLYIFGSLASPAS